MNPIRRMSIFSILVGLLFTILICPTILCEKADDEKRASLAYFKRSNDVDITDDESSPPKRASLAYYKRSHPLARRASLSYFKRAYNLCECPNPYQIELPRQFDEFDDFEHPSVSVADKRASLAYFKKRSPE